jgi:sodium-dependent dicarboxylate transporter 2/3/5
VSSGIAARIARGGLALGPAAFVLILALPAPAGMSAAAQRVAALAAWMGVWWITTAVPLEVTSLLPVAVLPLLRVGSIERATAPYANSVIFLFLGGFFLAAAMERWSLHKRLAYTILGLVGTEKRRVVLAFMVATGFLSMWISNTAAAVMMLPMAMAVLGLARETEAAEDPGATGGGSAPEVAGARRPSDGLGTALALGIAYSASIGGIGTLIGTPPNAIFAAAARQLYHAEIGFGAWMATAVPTEIVLLLFAWVLLTRWLYPTTGAIPGLRERLRGERTALGPLAGAERFVLVVFLLTAFAWIAREPKVIGAVTIPGLATWLPGLSDAGIAVIAALVLFAVPSSLVRGGLALDWKTAQKVPWGILLLFGGGLSLADAFQSSGLSEWIGGLLTHFAGQPRIVVVFAVATLFIWLTEITSNTAIAAMAMPLLAGIAAGLGQPPLLLMRVAALGTSMAFCLPVATPPNALVFATGRVTVPQMVRAGVWMNLGAMLVITVLGTWFL